MTNAEVELIGPVMANVDRLVEDATLLISNGRLPSAFVLDVIALEEVGKVVHIRWRQLGRTVTRQGRTGHLQKQWAVACLLIADKLLPHYKALILGPKEEQGRRMIELAAAFMDSRERRFFEEVLARNVDRAKQLGLYEDENAAQTDRSRESLDHAAVGEISDTILQALPLLKDDAVLAIASVFYEIMPPFGDAILADASLD